jgi:integrase/recombinase XerD
LALTIYPRSLNEYTTFLHKEAANSLKAYHKQRRDKGEKLTDESFVFRESRYSVTELNPKGLKPQTISRIINGVMKKAEIKRVKATNHRFDLAPCTGIRNRFNTKLTKNPNISYAIAENLMDHKYRLESHYLKPTIEELFTEYKKAIPELIIDDSQRKQIQLDNALKEKSHLEREKWKVTKLEQEMKSVNTLLEEIQRRINQK